MHLIEPFAGWLAHYDSSLDEQSPFYGKEYNLDVYAETIYGYYIDPAWDSFGSETLYLKLLYADYQKRFVIIEFIGEWNDALNNDIMHLKRNFLELLLQEGINKFILIGENILNFHGSDDSYYEEWFEELNGGWISGVNFPTYLYEEFGKYHIDSYITLGERFEITQWRTLTPFQIFEKIEVIKSRRIN